MTKREILVYISSFALLLVLVSFVGYLTVIPVPPENKDIVIAVLGVILGGAATAMPNLFGYGQEEAEKLKCRIRHLEEQLAVIAAKYEDVSERYDSVMAMLINRHFIPDDPRVPPPLPKEIANHAK